MWNLLLPSRMKPNILIWKNTGTFDPNRLGTGSKNKSPNCSLPTLRGAAASVSCPPSPCPWPPRSAHCLLRGQSHLKQTVCYKSCCRQDQAFIEEDSAGKSQENGTAGITPNARSICKPHRNRLPYKITLLSVSLSIFTRLTQDRHVSGVNFGFTTSSPANSEKLSQASIGSKHNCISLK